MTTIYIIIGVTLVIGLYLLVKGLARIWRRRLIRGSLQGMTGLFFIASAFLAVSIAMNLYTYQVFNQEQMAAEVRIESLGPQYFRLYFTPESQESQIYEVRGDQWQVDARIIKWHGLANMVGLKTVYRLERLSGRYQNHEQERTAVRSVHALADTQGLDLWSLSRKYKQKLPWVDAVYGNAAYMPLIDLARFKVMVSASGLLIRADNEIAKTAIENWK